MYFDTLFIFTRSKIEFANAAVPGNVDMWYCTLWFIKFGIHRYFGCAIVNMGVAMVLFTFKLDCR